MALTLDQIPQVAGPIKEYPNPHPTPELSRAIEVVAVQAHEPLKGALDSEASPLQNVRDQGSSARTDYQSARSELNYPRLKLGQASLNSELLQLSFAKDARTTIDNELALLASKNPAGATLPPVTFSTPELDAVEAGYDWMQVNWELAWPLWPFSSGW